MLRVLQIVISELNTLTPFTPPLNMASKVGIKWKVLMVVD
jgi:hypothetical protein